MYCNLGTRKFIMSYLCSTVKEHSRLCIVLSSTTLDLLIETLRGVNGMHAGMKVAIRDGLWFSQ